MENCLEKIHEKNMLREGDFIPTMKKWLSQLNKCWHFFKKGIDSLRFM